MDLMAIRRGLMMGMVHKLDTSPKIEYHNTRVNQSSYIIDDTRSVTIKYYYQPSDKDQTVAYNGTNGGQCQIYKNNGETYRDYWTLNESQSPRRCINIGSDAIRFTLTSSMLNESYAYLVETGQIFFAGKNTPYYGYTNISEMPTE